MKNNSKKKTSKADAHSDVKSEYDRIFQSNDEYNAEGIIANLNSSSPVIIYTDMNEKIHSLASKIYESSELIWALRDKVLEGLNSACSNSVVLYGNSGEGRTTLVQYVAGRIFRGLIPERFKGAQVIELHSFLFPTELEDILLSLYQLVNAYKETGHTKLILFFDDIEEFPEALRENYSKILQLLNKIPNMDFVKFITIMEKDTLFDSDECDDYCEYEFLKNSISIRVEQESIFSKILCTLAGKSADLMRSHSITYVDPDVLELIYIMTASKFNINPVPYKKYLYNIDQFFSYCQNRNWSKATAKRCVEYYSNINTKVATGFVDHEDLEAIAKHEAAHIVSALSYPEYFVVFGATIIPIKEVDGSISSGNTLIQINPSDYWKNRTSIIECLSCYMIGWVVDSEEDDGIGANSDLEIAYDIAKDFLLTSGLSDALGKNMVYTSEPEIPPEKLSRLDEEISKLLEEAIAIAQNCLTSKAELVDAISNALIEKKILTKGQISEIEERFIK